MLKQIYVKDFILLDEVQLDFSEHMSAFTGETGAGKSLLMDAIGVLKGDRVSAGMVKEGKKKAIIEGVFEIPCNHEASRILEEGGFELEDQLVIVTREISADGKSSVRINHRLSTVSFLKQVFSSLIDIHSQHDTQYLLHSKYHLSLLDKFGVDKTLLERCKNAYQNYKSIVDYMEEMLREDYNEDDLEFLTYLLNEIEDANCKENELEELELQQKKLQSYEKICSTVQNCVELLEADEGISNQLYEVSRQIGTLNEDSFFEEIQNEVTDVYYRLDDIRDRLKNYVDSMEYDEENFAMMQDRIYQLHKLYRKYGGSYDALMRKKEELQSHIDSILHRQEFLEREEKKKAKAWNEYKSIADEVHKQRICVSKKLEESILAQLHDLQLPNAQFKVSIEETQGNAAGYDKVEFLISMNRGERLKSLSMTASGGELSRFMLGLKCVFTRLQGIETIIFDEIDTGVSGSVAFSIGKKMQELSKQVQVFCVTHLAAVAACAHQHYIVEKHQDDASTTTSIHELEEKERIEHLAWISSNSSSTSALEAARELLEKAQIES